MGMNIGAKYNSSVQGAEYNKAYSTQNAQKHVGTERPEAVKTNVTNDISKKNEDKLSDKARDFLKNLRKQYGDYDFLVGNSTDDLKALSKSGSKEFSVIFSNAELERMATDEKYAAEKMQGVDGAVEMCRRICEQEGYVSAFEAMKAGNGTVNKISIVTDDNGNTKFFAELEKVSDKQKERLAKSGEKKAEEKKAEEKKVSEKKTAKKNPYEKDDKDFVKRTTLEANSMEELIEKIRNIDWNHIADSKSGDRFSFSV